MKKGGKFSELLKNKEFMIGVVVFVVLVVIAILQFIFK